MSKRIFSVLTIDGGGVKGVISARLLQEVEERTGKPVSELFDLIAGSSTGAILAAALAAPSSGNREKPRYSAEDMVEFYTQFAEKIFPANEFRQWKHLIPAMNGFFDPEPFETILKDKLEDLTLRDSLTHLMMAGADMKKFEAIWMSYFHERGNRPAAPQKWENLKMRDAIRASASPPLVFPAKYLYTQPNKNMPESSDRHAFLDGSLFAATLPRRAHSKAKQLAPPDSRIVVLSVGTGALRQSYTPDTMNKMSVLKWARTSMASTELTLQDILNDLYEEIGKDLCRLDVVIEQDKDAPTPSMFNATKENMDRLIKLAEDLISHKDKEIDHICQLLLERHERNREYEREMKNLEQVFKVIDEAKSVKALNACYSKIIQFTSDIKDQKPSLKDERLFELCQNLAPVHLSQLKEYYNTRHGELEKLDKAPSRFKSLLRMFNFRSKKQQELNDNKPPENKPAPKKGNGPSGP